MTLYNNACTRMHAHCAKLLTSYTRCIKNSNLRKEVAVAIKSKETSSQFKSVRNSYVATTCIKNSNLRKELGIAIKSKETSSQFESIRNSYVRSYNAPACNYLLNHVVKCMYK